MKHFLELTQSGITIVTEDSVAPAVFYVVPTSRLDRLSITEPVEVVWRGRVVHDKGRQWTKHDAPNSGDSSTYVYGVIPPDRPELRVEFVDRTDFPRLPRRRRLEASVLPGGVWAAETDGLWNRISIEWPGGRETHTFESAINERLGGWRLRRLPRRYAQYGPADR